MVSALLFCWDRGRADTKKMTFENVLTMFRNLSGRARAKIIVRKEERGSSRLDKADVLAAYPGLRLSVVRPD